jgi:hypothetical protein
LKERGLSPLSPPKFPSSFELIEPPQQAPRPKGLYEELLGARPEAIYLHALAHADTYEPEALPLLLELVNGQRSFKEISLEEQQVLDRACFDFATFSPKKPMLPRKQENVAPSEPMSPPTVDLPEGSLPPYWWVR